MIIDLSHEDLVNLVNGTCPAYEKMGELERRGLGHYTGGFADDWWWNWSALIRLSDQELYEIYKESGQR